MEDFLIALFEARTNEEISQITYDFPEMLDKYPYLWRNVRDARKRVNNLRRTKIALTELIYLN
jgi:hypothetical protein